MSCFFCDSNFHLSQYCNLHITVKSRQQAVRLKKCCKFCLSPFSVGHHSTWQNKCEGLRKCYICFTKDHHHTVFCPNNSSNFFVPTIDRQLFPRFLSCLDLTHQYSLLFSCPEVFDTVKFKPLKIAKKKKVISQAFFDECITNFVVHQELHLFKIRLPSVEIPLIPAKIGFFEACIVNVEHSQLCAKEISQLLSFHTKEILFSCLQIQPMMTLEDILKIVPNIESIDIFRTNIDMSSLTWPQALWGNITGNNFRRLKTNIGSIYFDIETLEKFLKKKSQKNVKIILQNDDIIFPDSDYKIFEQHLSENFQQVNGMYFDEYNSKPYIQITYPNRFTKYYTF